MPTLELAEERSAPTRLRLIPRAALVVFCLVSLGLSARQTFWYLSHGPVFTDFRIFMTGVDMVKSGGIRCSSFRCWSCPFARWMRGLHF